MGTCYMYISATKHADDGPFLEHHIFAKANTNST